MCAQPHADVLQVCTDDSRTSEPSSTTALDAHRRLTAAEATTGDIVCAMMRKQYVRSKVTQRDTCKITYARLKCMAVLLRLHLHGLTYVGCTALATS